MNAVAVALLSLPCALGFNVLSGFSVPGIGNVQDLEDFIVSNNLLPLGSLLYLVFCVSKGGWAGRISLPRRTPARASGFPNGRAATSLMRCLRSSSLFS